MIIHLKSKEEIEGFKIAGKHTSEILNILKKNVKPGISTLDLNQIVLKECEQRKVIPAFFGQYDFPAAICTSVNKCLVHGIPNNIPLKEDDIISIDLGINYKGYIGDSAITLHVAKSPIHYDLIDNCQHLLYRATNKAKSGNKLSDISREIQNNAKFSIPLGYGGHGISRGQLHAEPFVSNVVDAEEDVHLYPGMVLAIEPMLIDGSEHTFEAEDGFSVMANGMTAHCEHTVIITENDPIITTLRKVR